MRLKCLHADPVLYLPHANASIEAGTCELLSVRAPGYCVHSAALMGKRLHVRAGSHIPKLDERIIPSAGEHAPIRSKGHPVDAVSMPLPEQGYLSPLLPLPANNLLPLPANSRQGSTLQVPQLEAAVPTPAGQDLFVRAEGEGRRCVGMGPPDQV